MTDPISQELAIVVVNYGSHSLLASNLAAVATSCPRAQVVVVDNFASADERTAVTELCQRHDWALVASPANVGFGSGMNLGVNRAIELGATRFLLINPDATIDAESLDRLDQLVAQDPMILAAPVITKPTGEIWSDGTDLYLDRGRMRATRYRPADATQVVPWLTGACLLISRELWTKIDGFDDRYFLYWEDVDLSWRCREAGAQLMVVPEATAVHSEGGTQDRASSRTFSPIYYYYNIRNRLLFASQHLDQQSQRRWRRHAVAEAYAILLRGGRRQLLRSIAPWRAAITGTIAGLALMQKNTPAPGVPSAQIRVLQSFPQPRPTTNPYVVMLKRSLESHPEIDVDTFSWRRALTGRYDVFHAHWPEIMVDGRTPVRKLARQLLFVIFMLRLRIQRTAIVRTLHNLELPQGISSREIWLLRWFQRRTACVIRINTSTKITDQLAATSLHGHYRDWFAEYPRSEQVPGRFANFGLIRRYKAVDTLLSAFRETEGADLSLTVGGKPSTPELADELRELAEPDQRISLDLKFLTDAELVATASAAELVVLPYREMHNSGGVLAALSLDRPVLAPDNEVNRLLAEEVGSRWVQRYTGERVTAADLLNALAAVRTAAQQADPGDRPNLSQRNWDLAADQHLAAYRSALRQAQGTDWVRHAERIYE